MGQYAEIKRARVLRTRQNFSQVVQDIQGKLADTNAYVIQQRQSASDALTAWGAYQLQLLTQQNLIVPINHTHMTQCLYVGATLQCYTM